MISQLAFSKPTHGDDETRQLLTGFRAAGYPGLQLKMQQFTPWLDDPDGFMDLWTEPGVASALIWFDELDDGGVERLHRVVDFAVAVGSERVVYCHKHSRVGVSPTDLVRFASVLSEVGSAAGAGQVALSLHHHFEQPVMLPEDVRIFFGAVEDAAVKLTVDTAHLAKSGVEDIPGFIDEFAPVIDNIHLKDYADGEWRILGQGGLDLPGILAALERVGYDQWLCVDEE